MRLIATAIILALTSACAIPVDDPQEIFEVCAAGDIGCEPDPEVTPDEMCLPGSAPLNGVCAEVAERPEDCLGVRPALAAVGEDGGRCSYACETDGECAAGRTGYDHALWCVAGTCGWTQ